MAEPSKPPANGPDPWPDPRRASKGSESAVLEHTELAGGAQGPCLGCAGSGGRRRVERRRLEGGEGRQMGAVGREGEGARLVVVVTEG